MRLVQKLVATRFFSRRKKLPGMWQIIWWWEIRRIAFNFIVGLVGVLTCALMLALMGLSEKFFPEDSGGMSFLLVPFAIFGYGIAANLCYTGGWICEIIARKIWQERADHFGEISFAFGIVFSILLTLAPPALALAMFVVGLFTHAK